MRYLLFIAFVCLASIASAQVFTFQCVDSTALTGTNCDICPVTNIESRSFCGLLISKSGVPYKWIDQPYTMRVRPGDVVEYWEQIPTIPGIQTQDKITIALAQTPFSTIQGMIDSTYCHCASGQGALWYASDSLNHAPIFKGDTLTIVGRDLAHVSFDSLLQKYVIQVDSVSGGGAAATDLSYSIGGSPVTLFSSTGTDVGIIAGTGIGLSATATDLTITNTIGATDIYYVDNGGNDVDITSSTGTGFKFIGVNGIGIGEDATGIVYIDGSGIAPSLWTDAGAYTYLTATADRALVGSAAELNTSYILQAKGGLFVQGAGSTSGTFSGVFEKADGTDIMNIRNDGRVGILNSAPAYALDVAGDISIRAADAYRVGASKIAYNPASGYWFFGAAGNVTASGDRAIGIGERALLNLSTGTLNVAIGDDALRGCTTCAQNFAIGTGTLQRCTTGVANVGVGLYVLNLNTASNNTGIGDQVMTVNTTGTKNVGIGTLAVYNNTTASDNTGVGVYALINNTTGGDNTALGRSSLEGLNGGIRNIAIGNYAADNLTTGSRNICIGWNIDMPTATTTEELNIGNLIFGNGINASGTTISGGYIGIGVNAPTQRLHVNGNARVTGAYYDSNNDPGTASQVLSSTATGTDWVAAPTAPTILTLNNGLTLTGTNGQWGGALVQNTTIDGSTFYQLHKDGKKSFMRYEGNPFTDVNVTGGMDITGKAADPSINTAPSEDNIMTLRGHNGTSTYYANAMFFGTYTTAGFGSWIQTRSESSYTTHYPLNLNAAGGKVGIGRDPNTDQLDAHVTISRSLSGSTITGILMHIENTEGNKTAMSWGHGYDNIDGEMGYFDTEGIFRMTNRNTGTGETIRFAIGGETTDRAVMLPSTAASNVRFGVGFNNTTDLTSTLLSKGSLGAAALSTSGAPTFDETKFFVVYTAAGAQTYTLPAQADCKGRIFWIQNNSSAGTITLSVAVKKANGATFNTLAPGEFCQFISDGADFWGYKQTSL